MSRVGTARRTGTADALVTDDGAGHSRSALAAVRALATAGLRPAVARSGRWSLAAASRHAVSSIDVGAIAGDGYADAVRRVARELGAGTVLASSDAAIEALGAPVGHLLDKTRLIAEARRAGFSVPETRVFASFREALAAADEFPYPVVVKQPVSRVPARRISDRAALGSVSELPGQLLIQPFLDEPLRAVGGVVWNGRLAVAVHQRYLRTWPVDCGTASAALTVEPDEDVERRLLVLLDGYDGIFQAQFAGDHLLDLNPRVYGSLPLAVAAGANLPAIAVALSRGEEAPVVRARPGVTYRWIEGDVRAVLRGLRDGRMSVGEAVRALAPRSGTAHSVASLRDPKPFLTRLGYAMRGRPR